MANKSIKELPKATQIQEDDALPMQQGSVTKQVTGQTLVLWLLEVADGHGGVSDFQKLGESGLEKTYQFLMADQTTYSFTVTDGNGIADFLHRVSGLVQTYTLILEDGTQYQFQVTDGEKGEKGDNAYVWFKFASEKPTSSSSSMGDEADDWIGFYSGNKATAPTDPMEYVWAPFKGAKGATGAPATLTSAKIEYQAGTSGTIVPSGNWSSNVPVTTQGQYLWTRITLQFNTGDAITYYTLGYMGVNGTGAVKTVNGVNPDADGNVTLTAADVGALDIEGGTMKGAIHMNGNILDGLNDPTEPDEAVRKAYADKSAREAAPVNLLDNSDFTNPIAQEEVGGNHGNQAYAVDRWKLISGSVSKTGGGLQLNGTITQKLEFAPSEAVSAFVGMASGQASISYSDRVVTITSSGGVIAWAALYEGNYTEDTMPTYKPKGYVNEELVCKRYYQVLRLPYVPMSGAGTNVIPGIAFAVEMRSSNPTVTIFDEDRNEGYISSWGNSGTYQVSLAPANETRLQYLRLSNYPPAGSSVYYLARISADI